MSMIPQTENALLRPIYWHSGQYLDPHHLQQSDALHHWGMGDALAQSVPWFWGVDSLTLDSAALSVGRLSLRGCRLRFQDGSRVVVAPQRDYGNAVGETREFTACWQQRGEPFTVYAGLSRLLPDRNVAGILGSGPLENMPKGRFFAAENDEILTDRYALPHPSRPDDSAPGRTLYYFVRLFWESELAEATDHHVFPLLRLIDVDGQPQRDASFCPPLVCIRAWPLLMEELTQLRNRLGSIVTRLHVVAPDSFYRGTVSPALLFLQGVEGVMAALDMALSLESPPAWMLFDILRRGLAALLPCLPRQKGENRPSLAALPLYQHADCAAGFAALWRHYEAMANFVLPRMAAVCPFSPQETIFVAHLSKDCFEPGLKPVLVVQSEETPEILLREGRLLLGTPASVQDALRYALPGLPLRILSVAPQGLPQREDVYYFEPMEDSPQWESALHERAVAAAFFPQASSTAENTAGRLKLLFLGTESRS